MRTSPCRTWKCPLHRLQFAEQVPEMLAVPAAAAAPLHPVILRQDQRRFADDPSDRLEPLRTQASSIDRNTGVDQATVVSLKHLAGIGPEMIDRRLRA